MLAVLRVTSKAIQKSQIVSLSSQSTLTFNLATDPLIHPVHGMKSMKGEKTPSVRRAARSQERERERNEKTGRTRIMRQRRQRDEQMKGGEWDT